MAGHSGQGAWVHPCAWPCSDNVRVPAGRGAITRAHWGRAWKQGVKSGFLQQDGVSGWEIPHGESWAGCFVL